MSRVATIVPSESDLLCEGCGYTLNGLPRSGNCPECGKPIEQSVGLHRHATAWDLKRQFGTFCATTWRAIFQPTAFFRTITTRDGRASDDLTFALIHWMVTSLLLAGTVSLHYLNLMPSRLNELGVLLATPIIAVPLIGLFAALTWLATKLTCWEAAYRGYRLPRSVVSRALAFHSAHYLPVAVTTAIYVLGYHLLVVNGILQRWAAEMQYLYGLCLLVIVSAIYLFYTYWIAMKAMMWANR